VLCRLGGSLRCLRLAANGLSGPVPPEWSQLETLEELGLHENAGVDRLRDGWIMAALPNCSVYL